MEKYNSDQVEGELNTLISNNKCFSSLSEETEGCFTVVYDHYRYTRELTVNKTRLLKDSPLCLFEVGNSVTDVIVIPKALMLKPAKGEDRRKYYWNDAADNCKLEEVRLSCGSFVLEPREVDQIDIVALIATVFYNKNALS